MTEPPAWRDQYARELFTYEQLVARSSQSDAVPWLVPALALTAQAVLLGTALDPDREPWPTTVACAVGVLITVLAWQLMGRHRYHSDLDRAEMLRLEAELGLRPIADRGSQAARLVAVRPPRLGSLSSFRVWRVGLLLVAVVDVLVAVTVWWQPRSLVEWRVTAAVVAVGLLAALVWLGVRVVGTRSRA
ncbi:hypothetical protein ACI780_10680 [Geodermatophilus sp. SYSU D00814]